mmetsp:Transcript_56147/g.64428  ORF Transcript_56147/g.64428 Transcript_56147/m.64428 type:complete len:248 (+) Transcript_56147:3-746(+)
MFVLVYFGYKQYRIFCIECLTATLVDYIWKLCKQDMEKLLLTREDLHTKETANIKVKILKLSQQIDELDNQLKLEAEKLKKEAEEVKIDPKDTKAAKKEVKQTKKAGKKDEIIPSNPIEAEKMKVSAELDKLKKSLEAYATKLQKISTEKARLASLGEINLELLDSVGERKYMKAKLNQQANEFLTDKLSYRLAKATPDPAGGPEDVLELIALDGFAIRTVEEDEKYVAEPEFVIKGKDTKKGAKKK